MIEELKEKLTKQMERTSKALKMMPMWSDSYYDYEQELYLMHKGVNDLYEEWINTDPDAEEALAEVKDMWSKLKQL